MRDMLSWSNVTCNLVQPLCYKKYFKSDNAIVTLIMMSLLDLMTHLGQTQTSCVSESMYWYGRVKRVIIVKQSLLNISLDAFPCR